MAKKTLQNPNDYVSNINMNGLRGRVLKLPSSTRKQRNILFVYGHHSSIERWRGVIQDLSQYGNVTVPDMPGFGGMDSFYKIGKVPTIDNLADYLASFIKLNFKSKKITIVGLSFGFVVVTRMLQRFPDLSKQVNELVSFVGFTHQDDFTFSRARHFCYLTLAKLFSKKLPSEFFKNVILHPSLLRLAYGRTHNAQHKFKNLSPKEQKRMMDFEIHLWHSNDLRTAMYTYTEFLVLNNLDKKIDLNVWHVSVKADRYFNEETVSQHLAVVFRNVSSFRSKMDDHAPSIISTKKEAEPFIPKELRKKFS